jgi:hypothetical protein
MYGVPADLDLRLFLDDILTQVCLGQYEVQFRFARGGGLSVQGPWEVRDQDGQVLDQKTEHADRRVYRVHVLLGQAVVATEVDPPRSFTLRFGEGHRLTVFDDPHYESFSIQPGGIFV